MKAKRCISVVAVALITLSCTCIFFKHREIANGKNGELSPYELEKYIAYQNEIFTPYFIVEDIYEEKDNSSLIFAESINSKQLHFFLESENKSLTMLPESKVGQLCYAAFENIDFEAENKVYAFDFDKNGYEDIAIIFTCVHPGNAKVKRSEVSIFFQDAHGFSVYSELEEYLHNSEMLGTFDVWGDDDIGEITTRSVTGEDLLHFWRCDQNVLSKVGGSLYNSERDISVQEREMLLVKDGALILTDHQTPTWVAEAECYYVNPEFINQIIINNTKYKILGVGLGSITILLIDDDLNLKILASGFDSMATGVMRFTPKATGLYNEGIHIVDINNDGLEDVTIIVNGVLGNAPTSVSFASFFVQLDGELVYNAEVSCFNETIKVENYFTIDEALLYYRAITDEDTEDTGAAAPSLGSTTKFSAETRKTGSLRFTTKPASPMPTQKRS